MIGDLWRNRETPLQISPLLLLVYGLYRQAVSHEPQKKNRATNINPFKLPTDGDVKRADDPVKGHDTCQVSLSASVEYRKLTDTTDQEG